MTTLYHASKNQIDCFNDSRPIWFSTCKKDIFRALNQFADDSHVSGFVYKIVVDLTTVIKTTDFMLFHSGEILSNGIEVAKMESNDIDNNWYCFLNVNKFSPTLIKTITIYL